MNCKFINKTNKPTNRTDWKWKSGVDQKGRKIKVWNEFACSLARSLDQLMVCWCFHFSVYTQAVSYRIVSFHFISFRFDVWCVHFGINIVWNVIFRLFFYVFVSHTRSFYRLSFSLCLPCGDKIIQCV